MKNKKNRPRLVTKGTRYDVIILGSGIAGLGCAAGFTRSKSRVLLVGHAGKRGEATRASAGILDPLLEMNRRTPLLKLSLAAFKRYPRFIASLEKRAGVSTGFKKTGMAYVGFSRHEIKILKSWYQWQKKLNLPVRWLGQKDLARLQPGLNSRIKAGILYPTIGKVNPRLLKSALLADLKRHNVRCIKGTKSSIVIDSKKGIKGVRVNGKLFAAPVIIIATGSWSGKQAVRGYRAPVKPVRGQVSILRTKTSIRTILHRVEGSYLVPWNHARVLAGSTVESVGFQPQTTRLGLARIEKNVAKILPELTKAKRVDSWAGLRPCPRDFSPIIGPAPNLKGLYFATGYYRSGVLIGAFAGHLLAKGILSGKMPYLLRPFDPGRFFKKRQRV